MPHPVSVILSGPLETLRQLKKDVTEVRKGIECGISIRGFTDYRDGDQIQSFQEIEKPGLL
jgi:translation initiation factor IF-2